MIVRLAVLLLAAAFGSAQAGEAVVAIDDVSFTPARLVVPAGTHVTWTNGGDDAHTVRSNDGKGPLKSPPLDTGDSYAATFDAAGTYQYYCSLHPHMQGTVVVQ